MLRRSASHIDAIRNLLKLPLDKNFAETFFPTKIIDKNYDINYELFIVADREKVISFESLQLALPYLLTQVKPEVYKKLSIIAKTELKSHPVVIYNGLVEWANTFKYSSIFNIKNIIKYYGVNDPGVHIFVKSCGINLIEYWECFYEGNYYLGYDESVEHNFNLQELINSIHKSVN